MPEYKEELTPSWMMEMGGVAGGELMVNGATVQKVLSVAEVKALKVSSGATACTCMSTWGNLIGQNYCIHC